MLALCAAGFFLAGALTGLVWHLVAPLPRFRLQNGQVLLPAAEDETSVAADGWFAVCAAAAGVLAAVLVFARVRAARLSTLILLTVGGLLSAVVAWRVGVALGPDAATAQAARAQEGDSFDGPLRLSALGVLFSWPLASVVCYFALGAGLDPSRGRDSDALDRSASL